MSPTKEEINYGTLCHISALACLFIPLGNFFGPLAMWLLKKERSSFIKAQGKEIINFQISIMAYALLALLLLGIGYFFYPSLIWIASVLFRATQVFLIVMAFVGAWRSRNGLVYCYPLSIRFIK